MYRNAEQALSLAAASQPIDFGLAVAAVQELRPLAGPGASVYIRSAYEGLQQLIAGAEWNPVGRHWLAQTADLLRAMGEEQAALRALAAPTVVQRLPRRGQYVDILACA